MSSPAIKRVENNEELYIPENLEELLVMFYKKNNPENANNIPTILAKYKGKEKSLFNKLLVKYHEDPWPRTNPEEIPINNSTSEAQVPTRDTILYHVNKKVDELNDNLVKSENLIEKQKKEIQLKDEMIDRNCQQIEELSLSLEESKGMNEKLQTELNEKTSKLSFTLSQLNEMTEKYKSSQKKNIQLQNELETLQSSNPEVAQQTEVIELKERVELLQKQLAQKQNGMKSILSMEYQQMRKSLDEMEAQRDEFERINSDLALKIQQLEFELQKAQQHVESEKNEEMNMGSIIKRNEELEIAVVNLKKELELEKKQSIDACEEKKEEIENARVEQEGLIKQVDLMQREKEGLMTENAELKLKQEQMETWIEEERNRNEILQSEIQKKVQEGFDIEEERNVLQGMVKEIQKELKELRDEYASLQEKYDLTVKDNQMLKDENELIKRNTMEVNEQLSDSLIQKLQSTVDIASDKQPSLPVVSAAVDASAFTLKSFLEFMETVLSGYVLATTDLERSFTHTSVREIQQLLLSRVFTVYNLLTVGVTEKQWDPNDQVAACSNCHNPFGVINRKHHCRHCGQAFCSNCSNKMITFPGSEEKKRVCDDCFIVFDRLSGFMKEFKN